jgi:hypothetical protein
MCKNRPFLTCAAILTLTADRATGEAYCPAHHVTVDSVKRGMMVASLRYLDTFLKANGAWLFAERLLYVDWLTLQGVLFGPSAIPFPFVYGSGREQTQPLVHPTNDPVAATVAIRMVKTIRRSIGYL